jgi:ferredoxin-NADP reductase
MTGVAAACRRPLPVRRLGEPAPSAPPVEPNATLVDRRDPAGSVAVLVVRPDAGVHAFVSGQYFSLGLRVADHLIQRAYSAASTAGDDGIEFVIRLVDGGALTPQLWRLRPGDRVRIGPPKGLFRLADGDQRPHILVATGTGIAPLVSMAATLRSRPAPPTTVVLHGVARADELAMRDRLEAWAAAGTWLRYRPLVSRPSDPVNATWTGPTGRIDANLPGILGDLDVEAREAVAYVCGNPDAIGAVSRTLAALRMPSEAIVTEAYWPDPAR